MITHLLQIPQKGLADIHSWDPTNILEPILKPNWPITAEHTLAEITSRVIPVRGYEGPFIKTADIDDVSGAVTIKKIEQRDRVYAVRQPDGLVTGDLILSQKRPALYVTEAFTDLQFSTLFAAIRPLTNVDSLWIWACLNSTIGRKLLLNSGRGALDHHIQLSEISIPEAKDSWHQTREQVLALAVRISQQLQVIDKGGSWWRKTKLPTDTPWSVLLAVQDPAVLMEGTRFGDLVSTIKTGKRTTPFDGPSGENTLPVWGAPQLRGKKPTDYAEIDSGVLAEPGDILIHRIGLKGLAVVVSDPCLAGSNVMVLKLNEPELNSTVVSAFNSPAGQRQRSYRVTGTVIPMLTKDSLNEIRLDLTVKQSIQESVSASLSEQLDELIWQ